MRYEIKRENNFQYIEEGQGKPLILLHGLFGALSNWMDVVEKFKKEYTVIIPLMPIYTLPVLNTNVKALADFVHDFITFKNYKNPILIGNSLGGHVTLVYVKKHPDVVSAMVLTGSSGLYENAMGGTFPKREDYDFIRTKVEYTFFDPKNATKELVDEVFGIVNDRGKLIRILSLAKSAIRHNMSDDLKDMKMPVCLIWGKQDTITPPDVAEEFHRLLPKSDLFWIDKCGHAPMMEQAQEFNTILEEWLKKFQNTPKPE
ncbi:MAG: alpha/beta hydrolase [Bacteroidetes bacterium]|nr:alpha/beta hydrolase [Bacteroidota bacterium]MBP6401643.1 alpha/beta hydrolase [Bacteroidia bacterium]MBK6838220.1 alpha/beta hydrolase [Bacteroidota bacterium]MBK9526483.1 alpha/beta hydrolase [Bacteroidota bacterium]MBK9543939.1 alpha/beta hydrolase [Bacteroidota bacterium]